MRLLAAGFGSTAKGPPKNTFISSAVMSQYGNVFQKEHFTTQRYMAFAARAVYLKGWDAAERPKGCVAKTIVVDAAAAQEVWILSDKTSLSTSAICPRLLFTAFREDPNPIIACVPKSVLFGQAVFLIVGKQKKRVA